MTREEWLITVGEALIAEHALPITRAWRVAPTSPKGATLGMCYSSALTPDGANEIYISLSITDPIKAALTLLHELIHAADDNENGHKGRFETLALQVGFERPLTHYAPSDQLIARTKELLELLPPSPLVPMATPAKEKGRMVQFICDNPDCGFFLHTTRKQALKLEEAEEPACPCCEDGTLYQKRK